MKGLAAVIKLVWKEIARYTKVYPEFPDWPPGVRTANGTALCH
jgi:hypothetical protein